MKKLEVTEKSFSSALRQLLKNKKLTYKTFTELSGVSKTYLTEILVHNRIPSINIIEKISKALKINPFYFKEYRVLTLIENIKKYVHGLSFKDIQELAKFVKKVSDKTPGEYVSKYNFSTGKTETRFEPDSAINLNDLDENQKRIVKLIIDEFREINKDEVEKSYGEDLLMDQIESQYYGD